MAYVSHNLLDGRPELRNPGLDELRGLAIGAVIASHIALVFRDDSAFARVLLVPALGVGVDLFFVISGYLIVASATRAVAKADGFWRGAAAFWIGRVIRIGVPAWATLALLYAAGRVGGIDGLRPADLAAGAGFTANFYWAPCFAGFEGCGDPLLASHFWSLAAEMQFYALTPFLAVLRRRSMWILAAVVLGTGAVMTRPWGGFWWTLRPDGLLIGALLGLETQRGVAWIERVPTIDVGLASYWLLVAAVLARATTDVGSGIGLVGVAAIMGMIVAGSRSAGEIDESRAGVAALRWIGERSFSIYLVHLPVLSGVRAIFHGHAPIGFTVALAMLAATLMALCLDVFVTRPAMLAGRRLAAALGAPMTGEAIPRGEFSEK